jgi:hypothetical protein
MLDFYWRYPDSSDVISRHVRHVSESIQLQVPVLHATRGRKLFEFEKTCGSYDRLLRSFYRYIVSVPSRGALPDPRNLGRVQMKMSTKIVIGIGLVTGTQIPFFEKVLENSHSKSDSDSRQHVIKESPLKC